MQSQTQATASASSTIKTRIREGLPNPLSATWDGIGVKDAGGLPGIATMAGVP